MYHWEIQLNIPRGLSTFKRSKHCWKRKKTIKKQDVLLTEESSLLVYGWQSETFLLDSDRNLLEQQGQSRLWGTWARGQGGLFRCYVLSGPRSELQVLVLADHPLLRHGHPVALRRVVPWPVQPKSGFHVTLHGPNQVLVLNNSLKRNTLNFKIVENFEGFL